ncbi:restriction endonuclease subunit S [Vibrio splendidus]|uniref:Restriction endonuclease subunit S n=1 Tax=Vibrio splendidus TaxID=29497 RepID=A0ABD5A6G3_VIBSP|nr:restriction endonuclease subunit S [Vibrio splendidus]MDP2488602.1 restriction endonuclease subunit S [Vibrio splendidus]PMO57508.1 hypothetical protein BCT08_02935 [Vibrio splendidus]
MEWNEITLGDHIEVLTDYHANGAYEKLKANVSLKSEKDFAIMIRTLNFERGDFEKELIYINEKEYNFLSKSKVYPGDILMNKIADAGSVYRMPDLNGPVSLAMNLFLIRLKPSLNQRFMYYMMKFYEPYIKLYANGAATLTITKDSVRKLKFNVPSDSVQNKIAAILSAYDDLIENNLERIKLLEEMAEITYQEWFLRKKFPGHEEAEFDSETGLPDGWANKKMGDFLVLHYGKALKAGDRKGGSTPVYGSAGTVGYHDCSLVEGPGIVLGRKGNVGSVYWSHCPFYPIDTVYYVTSKYSLYFVYYLLKHQEFVNNDAAVPGLNRNAAYAKKVNLPNVELIDLFESNIEPLFSVIYNLQQQIALLKEARDVLLPRLMTGMIDIEKVELPEALLARINKENNNEMNIG